LQARIAALQGELDAGAGATRIAALQRQLTDLQARLAGGRGVVAAKTREMSKLARLIDEVPTRAELLQYERRFLELFDQVAEKLDETRNYFAVYNTLKKKAEFLGKEEGLIDSMLSSLDAMKVSARRGRGYGGEGGGIATGSCPQHPLPPAAPAAQDVPPIVHRPVRHLHHQH